MVRSFISHYVIKTRLLLLRQGTVFSIAQISWLGVQGGRTRRVIGYVNNICLTLHWEQGQYCTCDMIV